MRKELLSEVDGCHDDYGCDGCDNCIKMSDFGDDGVRLKRCAILLVRCNCEERDL